MKLSSGLGLAGVGLCAIGLALTTGCSSSSSSNSTGDGGGGGTGSDKCGDPGVQCTTQPAAPTSGSPTSKSHNYAVRTLYLGDAKRPATPGGTPMPDTSAWKDYGYNLDGLITTKDSTDVCTLAAGAQKTAQIDGTGGIDNSFGENILPIVITTAGSDAASRINQSISDGSFTVMTFITGFDDSAGSTANATGLSGVLLAGGNYTTATDGGMPTWDTNTHWPVLPNLITGCDGTNGCPAGTDPVANAQIKFPMAYQAGGTFVNGSPGDLDLTLSIGGQSLDLKVHSAIITFKPLMPGAVTDGTIAGTIVTSELIDSLKSVAGHISTSLCSGSAFDSIAQQITQASDILISGSTVSNASGQACNGISIGLGFEATEIAAPTAADVIKPQPPAPDPCADAGAGM